MKHLPLGLIYARALIGVVLVALSLLHVPHFAAAAIGLLALGVLTDVFDGIVARRLGVATERLRRLDSGVDQLFWALVLLATYLACRVFFAAHAAQLLTLLGLEALAYAVCYLRFGKEVATHSWAAKLWVLVSFAALVQVLATCASTWLFALCFYVGVASRLEILAIVLLLRSWTHDVPTFMHALRLRQRPPTGQPRPPNG